jgi:dGTPase
MTSTGPARFGTPPQWPGLPSLAAREAALLAPYAMHSAASAGREHAEPAHPYRGPFQRDRDRIVHSAAYRRLSYKTQVFTGERGDYHRTRLTHTHEVSSIARTMARALRLNEDLVEALALLHDIGHPPFGHCGEDILNECLADEGGFNHNGQALRIVQLLERRYRHFPGLNLSAEVLAGQTIRANKKQPLLTGESPLLEVQLVDAADSIAYDTHDADDALELRLLTLDELLEIPLWQEAAQRVRQRSGPWTPAELRLAVLHELIEWQVGDLLERLGRHLATGLFPDVASIRRAPLLVTPDPALATKKRELERFLFDKVYRHPTVVAEREEAGTALRAMFAGYRQRSDLLPTKFQQLARSEGLHRAIGDYIGGMTDRYALQEYERLFA